MSGPGFKSSIPHSGQAESLCILQNIGAERGKHPTEIKNFNLFKVL